MAVRQKKLFKHEWHLYSAVAITAALTFIVIEISSGKTQTVGVSFSGLVGVYFFASENWKNATESIHKWVILFSIIAALIVSGFLYYFNHKNQEHYE